jgi:hypothetical protein
MMITAARLKEHNTRMGNKMRSYTSARGNRYNAGNGVVPSAWRLVKNQAEIDELMAHPQFEIKRFESKAHFEAFINDEMEASVRVGKPAVRAAVHKDEAVIPMSRESDEARKADAKEEAVRRASQLLRPTPVGEPVVAPDPEPEPKPAPKLSKKSPSRRKKKA